MKITIERGKRRYEVVPCGRRCQCARPFVDATGHADVCAEDCNCPRWWRSGLKWDVTYKGNAMGLREIGGEIGGAK